MENILQLIKARKGELSRQQVRIADYILEHREKAAFLSATLLAREVGVSQPTVIRFAQFLGFAKYSMFTQAFQEVLKAELTSTDRLKLSLGARKSVREGNLEIISREMRTLALLANSFPQEDFQKLVEKICQCDRITIVGTRGSASLAQYFAYFLAKVKRNVTSVANGATRHYDRLLGLGEKDLVIGIAFPRYPRETVEMVRFCQKRGISVAAVTDKIESPLTDLAALTIVIPITFSTIFDAYGSAFCLFNMIVTDVGRMNRPESEALSREFEALAVETRMFL